MEAGRRLIAPPSIYPSKTHATIFLSFSVPVIHDRAAPAVACVPTTSIARNFPASVLMQEQHDDIKPSHMIREGRAQATLDRRWIENEETFCGDSGSSQYDQCIKDFKRLLLYWPGFWYLLPPSFSEDRAFLPVLFDKIGTDMDKLLNIESIVEAYNSSNSASPGNVVVHAKEEILASQTAACFAKESKYLSVEPDESLMHSSVPTELGPDVPVENKPMVKSRRLMQMKMKKRKVPKKTNSVTTKVSRFRETNEDEKMNYDDFDINNPLRFFLRGQEKKQRMTEKEEHDLLIQIQELVKLEKVKQRLHSEFGREPTLAECAKALEMSCRDLRSYLCSGNSSREKMIIANFPLVIHLAKQYRGRGLSLQDLLQEGNIGLMKSLEKFQPQAGCRFASYAYRWIQHSIRKAIFYNSRTIRLTENAYSLLTKITNAKKAFIQKGHHPTNEELAKCVGITTEKFQMLLSCTKKFPVSIHNSVWTDQDVTFQEVTADPSTDPPDQIATKQLMRRHVRHLLSVLTTRERLIIWLRYGMHDGRQRSLSEVGALFGLTKERVRQVESKALKKLKQSRELEAYEDFLT